MLHSFCLKHTKLMKEYQNRGPIKISPMSILWLVTFIWAFSFSLIGVYLSDHVNSYLAVFIRVLIALALLLPFFRPHNRAWNKLLALVAIGGIQVGATYLFLYHAFAYLTVPEVLLFTILTPLWITLIDEFIIGRRPLPLRWWLAAGIAVLGAAVIRYNGINNHALSGFMLIQGANLCFAIGQVAYKRLPLGNIRQQSQVFACFFLGASLVSGFGVILFGEWHIQTITLSQWLVLIWLGIGASAFGYLAWSLAIKQVNTGQVATMNNMLIPVGILVNYVFWHSDIQWFRFIIGAAMIVLSVWLCSQSKVNNHTIVEENNAPL